MEQQVYGGRFIQVTEERIGKSLYERAYLKHSVTVFPVDAQGRMLFIQECRVHENPQVRWKSVTGFLEEGATVEENANRELQEEIGQKAGSLEVIETMRLTGTINMAQHYVLARDLSEAKLPNPDGEASILAVAALPLDEVLRRTLTGEIARGAGAFVLLRLLYQVEKGLRRL